jgi:hypothetical protein
MPQVGIPWRPIEVGEIRTFDISFQNELCFPEVIVSASWDCGVWGTGTDPDPQSHLGTSSFRSTSVSVKGSGFLEDVIYVLQATVTTSASNVRKLWSTVLCVPSPVPIIPITGLSFDFTQPSNLVL